MKPIPLAGMRMMGVVGVVFAGLAIGGAARTAAEPSGSALLDAAVHRTAVAGMGAETLVRKYLARNPTSPEGLWLLATNRIQQGDLLAAALCYQRIPADHSQRLPALLLAGDQFFKLHDPVRAESAWLEALELDPNAFDAGKRLLAIYGMQLRREAWKSLLWKIISEGHGELRELVQLMIVDDVVWRGEGIVDLLEKFVATNPDDSSSRVSLVHHLLAAGRVEEALVEVDRLGERGELTVDVTLAVLVASYADAAAAPFKALVDADPKDLESWNHTTAWRRGLGELELLRSAPKRAVEHLLAAAQLEPFHPTGRQQLAVALRLLHRERKADLHARAANALARIEGACHAMQTAHVWTDDGVLALARDAACVGMIAEAKAWLSFALRNGSKDQRLTRLLEKLETMEATSSLRPPPTFLDPAVEAKRW